jgi:DNA-binding response OmpR family regulator
VEQNLIYIADDEAEIRELISHYLMKSGYDVRVFATGDQMYSRFLTEPADLIILDIMMPGTDGFTLCQRIRAASDVPIIIISARGDEFDRIAGINIGSDDYLCKPFSLGELVARVNRLMSRASRRNRLAESVDCLTYDDITVNPQTRTIKINDRAGDLTLMEYDFLVYLIQHSERAVSRTDLLREIWNSQGDTQTRAIDDLVKRLRKKLAEHASRVEIQTIRGYGFILTGKPNYVEH